MAFYAALFAAPTDVYAFRWENRRTGMAGWLPAVRGRWRKGVRHNDRDYLPLTAEVVTAHLSGDQHLGLYPLLDGDRCWWLAADFDGHTAMLDTLAYLKAARAIGVPAALEVSRSGVGAHTWVFFTGPVPAETARKLGTGLLREAIALRGRMDLASYDRLFPSQDVLPDGGVGNLIAAPLHGRSRRDGTTVFLNLTTMEPYEDQWAYLWSVGPDLNQRSRPGRRWRSARCREAASRRDEGGRFQEGQISSRLGCWRCLARSRRTVVPGDGSLRRRRAISRLHLRRTRHNWTRDATGARHDDTRS